MSTNFSKPPELFRGTLQKLGITHKESLGKRAVKTFAFVAWTLIGFFAAQYMVVFMWQLYTSYFPTEVDGASQPVLQLLLSAAVYVLALVIVVGAPRLCKIDKSNVSREKILLGVNKALRLEVIPFSLGGYFAYFLLTSVFAVIIQAAWAGFNADQTQDVGFTSLSGVGGYIVAFFALVIIPPIAEELLFRGYLFGHVRENLGFWLSATITSALFGFAHLQWNVGVDVFALSLVLCYLREKTGSVWAGILLHMLKNGIAFTILFLKPDILQFLFR